MSLLVDKEITTDQLTCPVGGCIDLEKCSVLKRAKRNINSMPTISNSVAVQMAVEGIRHSRKLPHNSVSSQICAVAVV